MAIHTFGLIAHVGAGKTSLAETMLARAGSLGSKPGAEGAPSILDFLPEEREHKTSLKCALGHLVWGGHAVDLIDTPGSMDFVGDTTGAMRVMDGAVMVCSAEPGLQGQTEFFWDQLDAVGMPRLVVINKMDREQADFRARLGNLRETLGKRLVAVNLPWGRAESFHGVIDLVEGCAWDYSDPAKPKRVEIPPELAEQVEEARAPLLEAVAESDDVLIENYLEEGTLTPEELRAGLIKAAQAGKVVPVMCSAATSGIGVERVLDAAVTWLPDADTRLAARRAADGAPAGDASNSSAPNGYAPDSLENPHFAGLVFKTQLDQYAGRMSLIKVCSGELHSGEELLNPTTGGTERSTHLYKLNGREQTEVKVLRAGELGALPKLANTHTGQTLCSPKKPVEFAPIAFPKPVLTYALQLPPKAEEDKISSALHRMSEADPTLSFRHSAETGDFLVSGMGKAHLDLVLERLKRETHLAASYSLPHVPYRETIRILAKAQGKHKKQTGGHGQYADCWLELQPNGQAEALAFKSAIVGGAIPKNYLPAIEKGIVDAMHKGVLAGFPVIGIAAAVTDGSYHDVDSSEMAFKIAGSLAFKKAMEAAKPVLLEPIMQLEIVIPAACLGDVMGDINARRGRVLGMDNRALKQVVKAEVPMAEALSYAIDLRTLTSGQGYFSQAFARYEQVPEHMADRVIKERQEPAKE